MAYRGKNENVGEGLGEREWRIQIRARFGSDVVARNRDEAVEVARDELAERHNFRFMADEIDNIEDLGEA